jgi:hypothetical protein
MKKFYELNAGDFVTTKNVGHTAFSFFNDIIFYRTLGRQSYEFDCEHDGNSFPMISI